MAALAVLALAGCGRAVSLPDADAYPAPVPAATREDPADSLQLEAVPVRDTAGLAATEPSADTALLGAGLAALRAAVPGVTAFDRISVTATPCSSASPPRSPAGACRRATSPTAA